MMRTTIRRIICAFAVVLFCSATTASAEILQEQIATPDNFSIQGVSLNVLSGALTDGSSLGSNGVPTGLTAVTDLTAMNGFLTSTDGEYTFASSAITPIVIPTTPSTIPSSSGGGGGGGGGGSNQKVTPVVNVQNGDGGACTPFQKTLRYGAFSPEVLRVGMFLQSQGLLTMPNKYYNRATSQAVQQFQQRSGISGSEYGIWGTKTMQKANQILGCVQTKKPKKKSIITNIQDLLKSEIVKKPLKIKKTTSCIPFVKRLAYGAYDGEVPRVRKFLQSQGYTFSESGNYYNISMQQSVAGFQQKNGISGAESGVWGVSTRKKANEIIGCQEIQKSMMDVLQGVRPIVAPQQNLQKALPTLKWNTFLE